MEGGRREEYKFVLLEKFSSPASSRLLSHLGEKKHKVRKGSTEFEASIFVIHFFQRKNKV